MGSPTVALAVKDLLARTRLIDAATSEGWTVQTSTDGVTLAADLIIIDLDQPGALAHVEQLRAQVAATPIVGFVSHVDAATRQSALALGVQVMTRGQAASGARDIFRTYGARA